MNTSNPSGNNFFDIYVFKLTGADFSFQNVNPSRLKIGNMNLSESVDINSRLKR